MGSDFGAVAELAGGAEDGVHRMGKSGEVFEKFGNLLLFPDELGLVGEVLILAAAALAKLRTAWGDAIGRGRENFDEIRFGEILLISKYPGADALPG